VRILRVTVEKKKSQWEMPKADAVMHWDKGGSPTGFDDPELVK
jgi:hypothetical protein